MRNLQFFIGLLCGLTLLVACAAVKYRYYGIELPDGCYEHGKLLGKAPNDKDWPDRPFIECKPDSNTKGKCVIQKSADFFAKDRELKECIQALSDCQRGNGQ